MVRFHKKNKNNASLYEIRYTWEWRKEEKQGDLMSLSIVLRALLSPAAQEFEVNHY